jgi:mannosyltransferase
MGKWRQPGEGVTLEHAALSYSRMRTYTGAIANVAVLLVVAISGLAFALRLLYLGRESFWSDEILSVQRASAGWFEGGTHMVAYHTMLRVWLILGDSELTIRLLSVIFAVATIPVIYLMGARLFSISTGVLASLLIAVNAYHIQYSQEARAYSLLVLMASLSSYFFVLILEKPSRLIWAGYVITSALMVYSHVFGGIILLAQFGSLLFLHWRRIPWKWMLSAWVATALLLDFVIRSTVGIVLAQVTASDQGGGGSLWIPPPTLETIRETLFFLTGNGTQRDGEALLIAYAIPIALALFITLAAWLSPLIGLTHRRPSWISMRWPESRESWLTPGTLPLSWLLLPILVLLGASLINPVFVPRYTLSSLPALALVAAVGFTYTFHFFRNYPSPRLNVVPMLALGGVLVVLLALSARGVQAYYAEFAEEDWRGVTQHIASNWQPGDGILFYMPWMEPKFRFYLDRQGLRLPESAYMVPESDWRQFIYIGEMGRNPDHEVIAQYLPDHYERVWLVLGHHSTRNRPAVLQEIRAALKTQYPNELFTVRSKIRVGIYRSESANPPAEQAAR